MGNPNLKPERDLSWEFGADQPLLDHKVDLTATYFHNDVRNLIEDVGASFDPANIGHATTEGVEAGVTVHPWKPWSANINYTYLTAVDDTTDSRLLRRPTHTVNFTTTYQPIKPVTISLGGSWVLNRVDADPVSGMTVDAPNYFVLRGNVTWQINKTVSVWLRGENLTNASYEPALGFPALSIGGYGGVKVSF